MDIACGLHRRELAQESPNLKGFRFVSIKDFVLSEISIEESSCIFPGPLGILSIESFAHFFSNYICNKNNLSCFLSIIRDKKDIALRFDRMTQ